MLLKFDLCRNHDGKNITGRDISEVLQEVLHTSSYLSKDLAGCCLRMCGYAPKFYSDRKYLQQVINLNELWPGCHVDRGDAPKGEIGGSTSLQAQSPPEYITLLPYLQRAWKSELAWTCKLATSEFVGPRQVAVALTPSLGGRTAMYHPVPKPRGKGRTFHGAEWPLFLRTFGDKDLKVPMSIVKDLLEQEKLPEGWTRPSQKPGFFSLLKDTSKVAKPDDTGVRMMQATLRIDRLLEGMREMDKWQAKNGRPRRSDKFE